MPMISDLASRFLVFGAILLSMPTLYAQQVSIAGLRVTNVSSRWSGNGERGTFNIQLQIANITNESGAPHSIAVAISRAPAQQGIADIMRRAQLGMSTPDYIPKAYIVDALGAAWSPVQTSGLPYGENASDWITIPPGGSTPAGIRFDTTERFAPPFEFNAELKVFNFDQRPHRTVPIHFGSIDEDRPRKEGLYPQSR